MQKSLEIKQFILEFKFIIDFIDLLMLLEPPLNMVHPHKKTLLKLSIESWLISKQWTFVGPKLDLPLLLLNKIIKRTHWASSKGCLDG
jgi:hypothetical protein